MGNKGLMKLAILGGPYLSNLGLSDHVWSYDVARDTDLGADTSVQRLLADQCPFEPDMLLFADQGCLPMLTGLEELAIPAAAYLIDTHLQFSWHRYFAGVFDLVFTAQLDASTSIAASHPDCRWLPLFSPHGDCKDNLDKTDDVVFVGTLDTALNPERVRFMEEFSRRLPLTISTGGYRLPFNRARIILNQSVKNDINFRVFEAMATGSMLLTDDVGNGLDQLFEPGCHLVTYRKGDVDDAVVKARYYLEHSQEREEIAAAGHAMVCSKHTLAVRSKELLSSMEVTAAAVQSLSSDSLAERSFTRKLAAGRMFLSIALLLTDLELIHASGYYGQRSHWYLQQADVCFQQIIAMDRARDELIKDLALLAFLKKETAKAATYCKIALIDFPCDVELLLLAARVAGLLGATRSGLMLYKKAADLISVAEQHASSTLVPEHLASQAHVSKLYL